jgi:hypothetical protein
LRPEALVASAPLGSLVQVMTLAPVTPLAAELFAVFFVAMDFLSIHLEVIIRDLLSRVQKKSHQTQEINAGRYFVRHGRNANRLSARRAHAATLEPLRGPTLYRAYAPPANKKVS